MKTAKNIQKYITEKHLDGLIAQINVQFDRVISTVETQIAELSSKVSSNGERTERMERDLSMIYLNTTGLSPDLRLLKIRTEKADNQLVSLQKSVDKLGYSLQAHDKRLDHLEVTAN